MRRSNVATTRAPTFKYAGFGCRAFEPTERTRRRRTRTKLDESAPTDVFHKPAGSGACFPRYFQPDYGNGGVRRTRMFVGVRGNDGVFVPYGNRSKFARSVFVVVSTSTRTLRWRTNERRIFRNLSGPTYGKKTNIRTVIFEYFFRLVNTYVYIYIRTVCFSSQ